MHTQQPYLHWRGDPQGTSYPGEHQPIAPTELFDAVQRRLAELRPAVSGKPKTGTGCGLCGPTLDEAGVAMLPTYTMKRGNIRYRYYASRPTLLGKRSEAGIHRVPAPSFEAFLSDTLVRFGLTDAAIERIEVRSRDIVVRLKLLDANIPLLWRDQEATFLRPSAEGSL